MPANYEFHTKIVGVTFEGRQRFISCLKVGENVRLIREPNNPHDKNAVAVYNKNSEQLGYVKKELAKEIAHLMDRGQIYNAVVSSITGGDAVYNYGAKLYISSPHCESGVEESTIKAWDFDDKSCCVVETDITDVVGGYLSDSSICFVMDKHFFVINVDCNNFKMVRFNLERKQKLDEKVLPKPDVFNLEENSNHIVLGWEAKNMGGLLNKVMVIKHTGEIKHKYSKEYDGCIEWKISPHKDYLLINYLQKIYHTYHPEDEPDIYYRCVKSEIINLVNSEVAFRYELKPPREEKIPISQLYPGVEQHEYSSYDFYEHVNTKDGEFDIRESMVSVEVYEDEYYIEFTDGNHAAFHGPQRNELIVLPQINLEMMADYELNIYMDGEGRLVISRSETTIMEYELVDKDLSPKLITWGEDHIVVSDYQRSLLLKLISSN